jgi:acyl-CoA thioesterase-1
MRKGVFMKKLTILTLVAVYIAAVIAVTGCSESASKMYNTSPIVCFGDSLTAGRNATTYGEDDKSKSYPAFLQKKLKVTVINSGVSGDTSSDGLARIDEDVLAYYPQIVIIEFGANDFFQGVAAHGAGAENLQAIIDSTKSNVQSMLDAVNDGKRQIYIARFFNDSVAAALGSSYHLDQNGVEFVVASYSTMFESLKTDNNAAHNIEIIDDIWAEAFPTHMSADGIHPLAAGYEIMAEQFYTAIKPYVLSHDLVK